MKRLFLLLAVSSLFICQVARSQTLPSGFSTTAIGSGWNLPLGTAFTNDGQKMFVWEKDGRVYVCTRNTAGAYIKQTTPVLDISEEVANWGDHGLMGFALDPNYLSNGLIYLLYVVDRHYLMNFGTPAYNPATSSTGATIGRITRYKTTTSGSNTVIDPATRFILLGETRQTGICIMHDSHGLGTLAFAADGTLLATAGDAGSYYLVDKGSDTDTDFEQALTDGIIRPAENVGAFRAQLLNSHNGKLLRIDPVTGNGVSSNPYYSSAQPRSPKSRVWALGLRNPFRFSIKQGTGSTNPAAGDVGEIFVGDVGWNTYEEVTVITTPGVNCGWPLYEGLTAQPGYTSAVTANLDEPNPLFGIGGCAKQYFNFQDLIKQVTADNNKTVFNSCSPATPIGTGNRYVHHRPSIDWRHFTNEARVGIFSGNTATTAMIGSAESNVIGTPFPGNCALGGPWYSSTNFPAAYQNKYFVADHDGKWIKCFSVDFTDVVTEVKNFGSGFLGTVNINVNPLDGTLIVVELGNFSTIAPAIKQIQYGGNQSPIVKMTSDKTFGPSVLNVNFTGNTSSDPDGTIAGYAWNFGDGGTSTSANPSHNFTAPANTPAKYVVKLTVTDNLGASSIDSIIISVNNTPPVVNITSPVKNSLYTVGPDTSYTCSATITDAEHNAAALKYEWQTILRHNSHAHPEGISTVVSPTTTISRIGCNGDDYYWLIRLTVTDAAGLSAVDSSKIFPDCSPGVDNTPPVVSTVSPLNGATNISTGTTVSATFNETIDPVTVTGTTFQLKNASNTILPASINTSFNQLTLTPSAVLLGSTVYTVTIKGGTSGVKDLAGNALADDYSWSFTTVAVDITPPAVTSVSPVSGATGITTGTTVTANFNEVINEATVTGATFELRDAGNIIPATISTSSNQIILTPSAALTGSTIYTVTIKGGTAGVKDLSGNALASDFVWNFTTGAVDNIPPTVSFVSPANAAIGVNTGTSVTATFSEAINGSTVTGATFQLKDAANNVITASVNTSSNVITLIPSSALAGSTTYTVTITGGSSGVKDLAGNALASNYSWSFTTIAVIPPSLVIIQSIDTKTGTAATVHSLTGVPAGALLVLSTTADAFVSDCIVSSSPSLTWTKRVDAGATSSDNAEIWTTVYAAGGSISVTSNWGTENSEASVCYVVLNAEPVLGGAFGTAVLQAAPSVTINTTRENSIIFGCTADWKAINGATRTLRDAATERLYFKDGHYTTYHYTKAATTIAAYTEGVSIPANQQSSTAILEIRGATGASNITPPIVTTHPTSQIRCAGTSVSFTSAADGTPVPTIQWQESTNGTNWTNIPGAVSSILSFTTTIADNDKQYRAVWTNSAGPVSSNPAILTVNSMAAPVVTVVNNCGNSVLTVESIAGSLLWSNGAASSSITVTNPGTYTVVQTVDGCVSDAGSGIATPKAIPPVPIVTVVDNCGSSALTASAFAGSLLWSTGETTPFINVATAGTYTVTQTVNECISAPGSGIAAPKIIPSAPTVTVANNCGHSVLTAASFTGSLLWSTGETTTSITVTTAEIYTVTQTVNGCISAPGSGTAAPIVSSVPSPTVTVVDNCSSSELTAGSFAGSLLWSTGETTATITVASPGTYTVTQTLDGCTSEPANAVAAPKIIPSSPIVAVADNCGNSVLTAESFTGSLLWNTGETTTSITVDVAATYTVTQTLNGCTSSAGSGAVSPKAIPSAPTVVVVNNCGNSLLTASDFTGSLLWSTGETTTSIMVATGGTYTVAQIVNGCTSAVASGIAMPGVIPPAPIVIELLNCGNSVLTASGYTGSLLWNTGETTESISVTTPGNYLVTQTVDGCISPATFFGGVTPRIIPPAPIVTTINNCGNSVLTASGFTGSLLWSTGETTSSIMVTTAGTYTVTQTVNGCTSEAGSGLAEPVNAVVATPTIAVVDDCGHSVLTAEGFTGTLVWSTGEITPSITVANTGTYTVTQTVNGCSSAPAAAIATPKTTPTAPAVEVANNCESSVLTASDFTGSLLWSTGETTPFITVNSGGIYTVTQTEGGCTSTAGNGTASPIATPTAPSVIVVNNCGNSVLTASGFSGTLLWSTGETTSSIMVATGGTYTVTQTVNGCTSEAGSGLAEPVNSVVATPTIAVVDDCGQSVLTAEEFTGTLLWNTGATTPSITVADAGTYTVTQIVNGCSSAPASGIAIPKAIPPVPAVEVTDNCESSTLTASGFTGSLLWSTAETTASITVNNAGTYTVTQNVNGCISNEGSITALPKTTPVAPTVNVVNNCGNSVLTASGFTGSLLWSNGATSSAITVNEPGIYTVTQTVSGCTSPDGSGTAAPFNAVVDPPTISVVDNCTNSVLTAESFTGTLLWSNGATTPSITVSTPGTYTVTQTVNGCTSPSASGTAVPIKSTIETPTIIIFNDCGSSVLMVPSFTGSLSWNNGPATQIQFITVTEAGTYFVTQTVNGCTSDAGSAEATPKAIPSAPGVTVVNNCGSSILTASGFTGSLLWSNGETTASITVNTEGTYTVTQTINGCTSEAGSGVAAPNVIPLAPTVSVVDDCGSSTLTAGSFTGTLLWSNAATTTSITVNSAATYTVTQTISGCTSIAGSGVAAPKPIPVLSGNLAATAISGSAFTYTATSATTGTTFAWSRAAVTGISNVAASGTGNINETLVNTLSTPVNVTYVYTLTANGCTNTQNVVVSVSSVPVVTTVSPVNGTTGVSVSSPITANFSEAINGATVTTTTFQIKDAGNNIIPATVSTSSSQITLTPSAALANSMVYTVTIRGGASGVKGLAGNAMVNDYTWSFTTVAAPSQPPVTIQSVTTKTGTATTVHPLAGVPAGALLVLATTADAAPSNCIVSSTPSLTWTKRVDAGAASSDNAEIWTAVYTAGGSITVNSNWGADNSQTSVCYVVLNAEPVLAGAFGTAVLQAAPSVTITTTRENSIIFGCTADWKAINGATRTLRDAATERLYFRDGNYTTYHYTKGAATIGAYTEGVSLPTGQQSSTALLEIRSVSGAPDVTSPTVSSVSPLNGATGVPASTTASAIFNEAMNATTINSSTIELRNASNALITATVSYNAGTRTTTITPSVALANSTMYTVTIKAGVSGVKDAAGNALASDYNWSFTTVAGDITSPTVTSVTPLNGATGVPIGTTVSAIFNEAMNATTINSSTIELRNSSNSLITSVVSYNAATRTVTLTPSASLANSTLYTAKIIGGPAGAKDVAGNALAADYSWSFTTVVADIVPPTVTSVSPINGATVVSVNTTVTAIFNEAMNAATMNGSTIELRNSSNALITAVVSYNAGTRTVTLTPSVALANSTIYTAKVISGPAGVKDAAGNALTSDYSWSFTTATATSQLPVTIQSVTTKTGIAATSHPLTGVPAGALLVLATTADAFPSDCIVASTPSLTWTKRVDAGATSSDNAEIWTAVYTAGGSITVNSNWGTDNSQTSVCYVVLNAEPVLGGASAIATLQSAPSVTITTTRENSIIFGCTADWKAINGATRTLRDAATERLYFRDGHYTTYYYTKGAATIASYTEGVSLPTGQQASTALLEIRSAGTVMTRPADAVVTIVSSNPNSNILNHSLGQNYPNPFENETSIPFALSTTENVKLVLFDMNGRVVKVLVNASKDAGKHVVKFNAGSLAKGIYYYRIQAGGFTDVKKLIIF